MRSQDGTYSRTRCPRHVRRALVPAVIWSGATIFCSAFIGSARAADLYVGASVGDASQNQGLSDAGGDYFPRTFPNQRLGWKLVLGTRPISWLGGEIEYLDFGSAHLGPSYVITESGKPLEPDEFFGGGVRSRAAAVAAVGYVPQPIRWLDVFGKLGAARLWTSNSASGYYPDTYLNCATTCTPLGHVFESQSFSDFGLLYGGGLQTHFGALALRLEYERIHSAIGQPFMVSIGANWEFGTHPYFRFEKVHRAAKAEGETHAAAPAGGAPIGLYVGAGLGAANQDQGYPNSPVGLPSSFNYRLGWKLLVGARMSRWLGAELEYIDFGSTHQGPVYSVTENGQPLLPDEFFGASGRSRAAAAVAVGYVPLPFHSLELFGKLGPAHVMTQFSASAYYPDTFVNGVAEGHVSESLNASDNGLVYGGGVQAHFGGLGLRLEYERISSSIGEPYIVTLGANWTFGAGSHFALQPVAAPAFASEHYYIGLSVGQSSFQTAVGGFGTGVEYRAQPFAWKALVGLRPLSFLGAEIEYIDFGGPHFSPSGSITSASGAAHGEAGFMVGYLPVPNSNIEVFGKLGEARYQASYRYSGFVASPCAYNPLTGLCVSPGQAPTSGTDNATGLAYGVGAQYRFGSLAVRAELEKISTTQSFTAPSLLSAGLIYRF